MTDGRESLSNSTEIEGGFDEVTTVAPIVRVKGDSPYGIVGLQRARRRAILMGSAFLDVRVVKDFDPTKPLHPEKIINITNTVRFLNEKPATVLQNYVNDGKKIVLMIGKTAIGKTTKIPRILLKVSEAKRMLVIEPHPDIVMNVYRYLVQSGRKDVAMWRFSDFRGSHDGVVYSDGGTVASAIANDFRCLDAFDYVILDEAHETSGVYYALRVFLNAMKSTTDVIFMSATLGDVDDQDTETEYKTAMTKMRAVDCRTFLSSVTDNDFWHYRNIHGRVMILVDTDDRCQEIAKWYNSKGVTAMCYGWNITSAEYGKIFEQLVKDAGRNVVLVSTCAARTGVTLPIDSVIDLRETEDLKYDYRARLITIYHRTITVSEAKQGVGRVGRMSSGRAYVVPKEFEKFAFNIRPSHKIYACLWLICMGFNPSPDVFPNERAFLGKLPRLGAAQLLNVYLHPVQARFYMDDDGLFYANFQLAIQRYAVSGVKIRYSDKCLDVAASDWFQHSVSIPCLNGGATVTLHLPNDPSGTNNAELLDCAVLELKWKNEKGPYDYAVDSRTQRVRPRYVDDNKPEPVKQVEERRLIRRGSEKVNEMSTVAVVSRKPSRSGSLPNLENLSRFAVLPGETRGGYLEMADAFPRARMYVCIQPIIPYDDTRDFLLCTAMDEIMVEKLLSEVVSVTALDSLSRRLYHDSFCAVWNKYRAKESFARGVAIVTKQVFRPFVFRRDRDRDEEALNAAIKLQALGVLDEQFRIAGMFVKEATRYLKQHSSGSISRDSIEVCRVLLAGRHMGYGVIIGTRFYTLDHVCGNVPITCIGTNDLEFLCSGNLSRGVLTMYDCPVERRTPCRSYVDGEPVYVTLIRNGVKEHFGPFESSFYDNRQMIYRGFNSVPGASGAVLSGEDGMIIGLHVGVLDTGSSVCYFIM